MKIILFWQKYTMRSYCPLVCRHTIDHFCSLLLPIKQLRSEGLMPWCKGISLSQSLFWFPIFSFYLAWIISMYNFGPSSSNLHNLFFITPKLIQCEFHMFVIKSPNFLNVTFNSKNLWISLQFLINFSIWSWAIWIIFSLL